MLTRAEGLLSAARLLLDNVLDDRLDGNALVRRSASTAYYALFHFLLEQCALGLVGEHEQLARRRNIFMRTIPHRGLKLALGKVAGAHPARDVLDLFARPTLFNPTVTPAFVREFANIFLESYEQRQQADYDYNVELAVQNVVFLITRAAAAIEGWLAATAPDEQEFKQALYLLIALHGRLRAEGD